MNEENYTLIIISVNSAIMLNLTDIITAPFKLATFAPRLLLNLCNGKTELSDLIPCGHKSSNSSSGGTEDVNENKMFNPIGG